MHGAQQMYIIKAKVINAQCNRKYINVKIKVQTVNLKMTYMQVTSSTGAWMSIDDACCTCVGCVGEGNRTPHDNQTSAKCTQDNYMEHLE